MPEEDLINFIKQRLAEGFDEKAIRETLLETGYLPEEIEKAFKAISEKEIPKEPEKPRLMEEVLTYQPEEKTPISKKFPKKILLPLIILVALIFIGGVSAFLLPKILKPDPISLLPQETSFYLKIKINPKDKQVKNLKENLNKFPYYEKLSQKISEEFERFKKENPPLRNLDFTISDEVILAWITPFEFEPGRDFESLPKKFSLVLIFPDPDLKKLANLAKDVQEEIKKSKDWKLETEKYRGREIYTAVPTLPEEELKLSTTFTNGHFVLASKPEDIKKIIDVAEDQGVSKIFKRNKLKNINSSSAYRKIKRYFPKDYLALYYGQFDLSKIIITAEKTETVREAEKIFPSLTASLKTALELPFFKKKEVKEPEKVALAEVIIAEKNGFKAEIYSLNTKKDAFEPAKFQSQESLANFLPEKIGNQEIAFYIERRNFKKIFDYFEETLTREIPPATREKLNAFYQILKLIIKVDLKKDIISLFEKNYAFSIYSEPTGKETPIISFIFEVDDENKVRENLLKIRTPRAPTPEERLEKAKNYEIIVNMRTIPMVAEWIYTEQKSYKNVNCDESSIKTICQKINEKVGGWYPFIYQSRDRYCAYTKLNEPGLYYCIEGQKKPFGAKFTVTSINPGDKNYCTKKSFICPPATSEEISLEMPEPIEVGFSKETVDGFEIYSLPVFENFGLNFSIKDKKLVFSFTKESLVNILKGLTDLNQKKLKDSQIFVEQFKEIPKEITEISYIYPYGFIGTSKYLLNFFANYYMQAFASPEELESGLSFEPSTSRIKDEPSISRIKETLDKGIAPYLKVLKTVTSYSYSPEKGLNIGKGRLVIEELPAEEKKETEEFWQNREF